MSELRRFVQVDVFTDEPLKGNALAVVVDGGGLSDEQACWPRSWSIQLVLTMPWSRNDPLMAICACASSSAVDGAVAQPASSQAVAAAQKDSRCCMGKVLNA